MGSIKKNFVYNSFLSVSNYLISLVLYPYCARVLGVERMGTVNFVQNIVAYFLLLASFGLTTLGVREIAKSRETGQLSSVFNNLFSLNLLFTFVSVTIYTILIFLVPRFHAEIDVFTIGIAEIFFTTVCVDWLFKGLEDFKFITLRSIIIKIIYIVLVLLFVKNSDDYVLFYALTVTSTIVTSIVNISYARKTIDICLFRGIHLWNYFKGACTIGLYALMASMYTTFNVAFLGFMKDDTQVGLYTTSLKLYTIILGFITAFSTVMLPRMSSLATGSNTDDYKRLLCMSFELLFAISLPIIIFLLVYADECIYLLAGGEFLPASNMSRIVIPLIFFVGIAQILTFQILIPKNLEKISFISAVIGAFVGIILNILLVPKYAGIGTCISLAITEITVTVFLCAMCIRKNLFQFPQKLFLKRIVSCTGYIVLCALLSKLLGFGLLSMIISACLCAIYFVIEQSFILKNEYFLSIINKFSRN